MITAAPGAVARRGRAVRDGPRRARDVGDPQGRRGPVHLEVRPVGGHRRVRGRHRHLLRAADGPRAHAQCGGCRPGRIRPSRDGTDRDGPRRGLPVRGAGRGALAHGAGGDARLVHRAPAPHGARHRRGQQLRRRGQAVPGGDRSEAPPGGGAVGGRGDTRARTNQRQRRRRLHRAQPRADRHRHRGPGHEPRRSEVGRGRRDAAGRPHHGGERRRRPLRAAPAPRAPLRWTARARWSSASRSC